MDIIISPAKKMNINPEAFSYENLPALMSKTEALHQFLKKQSYDQLKKIWSCSDKLASFNYERLHQLELSQNLTPALFAYEGIQYQYMAPDIFTDQALAYIKDHLFILSGFYGILSAFDGIIPYRLEMQAKLTGFITPSLYDYWGPDLANYLKNNQAFNQKDKLLLNLASDEYSKAVIKHLPPEIQVIHFKFGQVINGKVKEKGTLVKMARGEMVRFLAENQVDTIDAIKAFNAQGFHYNDNFSKADTLVFTLES